MRYVRAILLILMIILAIQPRLSATDVSGDVWGVWTADDNPYNVVGELRVPPGSLLVIEPGCYIEFQDHYKFIIDSLAVLRAIGAATDSVIFTAADTSIGWHGLRFYYADSGSQISYCRIEFGKAVGNGENRKGGGIYCVHSNLVISHNTFYANSATYGGGAIYASEDSIVIKSNLFTSNFASYRGGAIFSGSNAHIIIEENSFFDNDSDNDEFSIVIYSVSDNHSIFIRDNIFQNNEAVYIIWNHGSDGMIVEGNIISDNTGNIFTGWFVGYGDGGHAVFKRNIIFNNSCPWYYGGLVFHAIDSGLLVENNTIFGNTFESGYAVGYFGEDYISPPVNFVNNIIWDNRSGPNLPVFYYDDVDFHIYYSDVPGYWPGYGNIEADPMFVDPENGDFHLLPNSPCIDTGDPNSPYDPDGTRADMGALPFDQITGISESEVLPSTIFLSQNYPNPFNASTEISYSLHKACVVSMSIYDLLGRKVETLFNRKQAAGYHQVTWDAKNYPSGIYFYRIQAGDYTETKKMVLLK